MFGIPMLTKSCFGKNQSYEVLTPDRGYVLKKSPIWFDTMRLGQFIEYIKGSQIRISRFICTSVHEVLFIMQQVICICTACQNTRLWVSCIKV